MAKSRQIGGVSFSEKAYDKFVSLSKEDQINKIADSLPYKDTVEAERLLTRVKHDSSGTKQEVEQNNATEASTGNVANNNEKSRAAKKGEKE